MNSRFAEIASRIQLALTAAVVIAAALAWPGAPDRVPVHWNAYGEIDRWGGRVEGILALPAVVVFLSILQRVVPRLDPRRAEYARFAGPWAAIWLGITVVMACVYAALLLVIRGHAVDMTRLGTFLVGGLFVVIGASWIPTYPLARWAFILTGLLVWVATVISPPVAGYTLFVGTIAIVVACTLDAFVWRRSPDKAPPAGGSPAQ